MTADPPTPRLLVEAYAAGWFPMARSAQGRAVDWYSPDPRAVLPLDALHVRRSLAKALRRQAFGLRWDNAFDAVVAACAEPRGDGSGTWINPAIADVFGELHRQGLAHSVEAWADDALVGGLYGLSLGGAFFAESMFSRRPYASQACLVALVDRMRAARHTLLDVQFTNPHLEQFGVVQLPRDEYLRRLDEALRHSPPQPFP